MARKKAVAAPVVEPVVEPEEVLTVDLFDATPVQINGVLVTLPKGKQEVSKHIYNVLKDANLIK